MRQVWAVMVLAVLVSGCDLGADPLRLGDDPALIDIATRDAGPEDTADPDVALEPDAAPDVVEPGLDFVCQPPCLEDQFCGPGGICFERRGRCIARDESCDPATAPRSDTYLCEPLYGGEIGVCRQVCDPGDTDACLSGNTCSPLFEGSEVSICRQDCSEQSDCDSLDACVGGAFGECRGRCRPFLEDQCAEGLMCAIDSADSGHCEVAGAAVEGEACGEVACEEGLRCSGTGQGNACQVACAPTPGQGGRGACASEREVCDVFEGIDLGVCRQRCDLFDESQRCLKDGQGCLIDNERTGLCIIKGRTALGNNCQGSAQCAGDLQCVIGEDGSRCSRICLRGIPEGQDGACAGGETCQMVGFGALGVCVP